MPLSLLNPHVQKSSAIPLCPIFGECGGCQYQDIPYQEELRFKEASLRDLIKRSVLLDERVFDPIVPSPREYYYRSRLDLKLLKTRNGEVFMGFSQTGRYRVIEAEKCPIAMESISAFLPELKKQACQKLPVRYRNANLVVKTGDDGRVFWGGIGRRSLRLEEKDYLWTEIHGRKIFYSLDTFFQANLFILPELMARIENFNILNNKTTLYDFYGGVGLFGIYFSKKVKQVVLIEENIHSVKLAQFNISYHQIPSFKIIPARAEGVFPGLKGGEHSTAIVDPPRQGLSEEMLKMLTCTKNFDHLLYLSCNSQTLTHDLSLLLQSGWQVNKICPFDFFPKTKHIETLVWLSPKKE